MKTTLLVKMLKLMKNAAASKQCKRESIQITTYHHLNQNLSYLTSANPTFVKYASVLNLQKTPGNMIREVGKAILIG